MVEQVCKVVWVPGRRVEAGHVRIVRATLPAARIAAVERGSRGFGRYAFLSAHCTDHSSQYVPLGKCIIIFPRPR
jgi:hypothetical protein